MSGMAQGRESGVYPYRPFDVVRFTLRAGISAARRHIRQRPFRTHALPQLRPEADIKLAPSAFGRKQLSFDYFIGTSDDRGWNSQSKCGSRFEIQRQFERDRLLYWKLCRLSSLKYPGYISGRLFTH